MRAMFTNNNSKNNKEMNNKNTKNLLRKVTK